MDTSQQTPSIELLIDAALTISDLISRMEPYWIQMRAHDEANALIHRINEHVSTHARPDIVLPVELFVCDICARSFKSKQARKQHRRDAHFTGDPHCMEAI